MYPTHPTVGRSHDTKLPDNALCEESNTGTSRAGIQPDSRIGRPRRILVVGGGPAGLIALHELLSPSNRQDGQSLEEFDIQLFERRADVGGVWYFEPDNEVAKGWSPAQADVQFLSNTSRPLATNKPRGPGPNIARHQANGVSMWPSPAYAGLVGNVLPPLLQFSAEPFPEISQGLFPSMTETHQYLLDLATRLRAHISTRREVSSIIPASYGSTIRWIVTTIDWSGQDAGVEFTEEWDAVIVAAGAFDHPFYPDISGLAPLLDSRSPLVMHAKTYAGPHPFMGQHNRIVVVGNANSANDIAAHLAPLNSGPIYRCIRHPSLFAHLPDDRIQDVPPIARIDEDANSVTLSITLENGRIIDGVTKLIFASGYQYKFDYIRVPTINDRTKLEPASRYGAVPNLHNGTFLAAAPTLAFIGLAAGSSPMPFAEVQSRVVARVLNNLLRLPDTSNLLQDFHSRIDALGLRPDESKDWRLLHMVRGNEERRLNAVLLDMLENSDPGSSGGLFRWDERRESVVKTMRAVKEGELKRLRDARAAAFGLDGPGGVGGVLDGGVAGLHGAGAAHVVDQAANVQAIPLA